MIIFWGIVFILGAYLWEKVGLIAAFATYIGATLFIFELLLLIY